MITVINKEFTIEPLKDKPVIDILNLACSLLSSLNVLYWVSYGTCLGIVRDGKPIEHDTDIDIDTVGNHRMDDIRNIFNDNGFELIRQTIDQEDGFEYQNAYIHKETNMIVDITFFNPKGNLLFTEQEYSKVYTHPIEFLGKIFNYGFLEGDNTYPMIDYEIYLKFVYGKDWRTPLEKKDTKYFWGRDD
jgi:hypothetical protein